jgi:hypothetical protein
MLEIHIQYDQEESQYRYTSTDDDHMGADGMLLGSLAILAAMKAFIFGEHRPLLFTVDGDDGYRASDGIRQLLQLHTSAGVDVSVLKLLGNEALVVQGKSFRHQVVLPTMLSLVDVETLKARVKQREMDIFMLIKAADIAPVYQGKLHAIEDVMQDWVHIQGSQHRVWVSPAFDKKSVEGSFDRLSL